MDRRVLVIKEHNGVLEDDTLRRVNVFVLPGSGELDLLAEVRARLNAHGHTDGYELRSTQFVLQWGYVSEWQEVAIELSDLFGPQSLSALTSQLVEWALSQCQSDVQASMPGNLHLDILKHSVSRHFNVALKGLELIDMLTTPTMLTATFRDSFGSVYKTEGTGGYHLRLELVE